MRASGRRVRVGLALAIVAALAVGCGPFAGESGEEEGAQAAAAYQADLRAFAAELKRANPQRIARLAAEPPTLADLDTDEASYAAARELAGRVEPIAAELRLLAGVDPRQQARLANGLYSTALGFADSVISRSADYQFPRDYEGVVLGPPAVRQRRATNAIEREIEAWKPYRRKVAATPARDQLSRSFLDFELEEIDYTLGIFEGYRRHLRETRPDRAATAYWDDFWPLESPLRLLPSGVFAGEGDPYLDSLYRAQRIIRSQVRAIQELARSGEVGPGSPSVGDAYRDAIVAGFVSPLAKVKSEPYRINFRAWMLYRIRELEDTPREAYEEALETIWIELIDDSRNPYDRLLAALAGFNAHGNILNRFDLARLRAYIRLIDDELGGPVAPILEPTRNAFLRALESIRLDEFERGIYRGNDLDELTDSFDASDRAHKSKDEAREKIERAMQEGAKRIDSPKQLRRALERALAATAP